MSHDESKVKHSRRIQQKKNHILRQFKIAKEYKHTMYLKQPHRLAKHNAMDCGQPNCMLCGNPRRTLKIRSIQEKRFDQTKNMLDYG